MLNHELKSILRTQSRRDFRSFGTTMGIFLMLLGLGFNLFSLNYSLQIVATGGLLLMLGAVLPAGLRPLYILWMTLAALLGFIMTRILLGIIFFLIFAPVGLIFRLIYKDLLDESIEPTAKSYWKARDPKPYAPEMSEKQF